MNSTKFVCTHMLAQSACDALFSETVGTEFFCPPCEFFALVFQSQQKFQATITKKLIEDEYNKICYPKNFGENRV